MDKQKKLYVVANAHLDTQWNWTIQHTIRECIKNTLERNFDLIERYPHYRMNFEGAFRYKLAKEYYPDLYEKLKKYVAEGRWNVAGSTWDAMDANVPSSEGLMRQILYGNGFFEKEFGKKSTDIFLSDCFGFRYALPSIEAHMGLNGFSTQKLAWGVGGPVYEDDGTVTKPMPCDKPRMDLGKWVGPDGNYVVGCLLAGNYNYDFDNGGDESLINSRENFLHDIEYNEERAGVPARFMYYGTGDYGGSCKPISAKMVTDAVNANGTALFDVVSASTDQIFNELTQEQIDALPAYDGELLIPHGSGAVTSHTINKRWNRKNELLADSAERAAVLSAWLGAGEYPADRLLTAWQTFLWHQFHDDLPGTSIAEAYVFTYNDYVIALNTFASELAAAVGGVASTLDTRVEGTPVVVYNPVSCARRDVVEAALDIRTPYVRVFDAKGNEVPAQLSAVGGKTVVKFIAPVEPVSCSVFDVRASETPSPVTAQISLNGRVLENQRYIVTVDENGDIASIRDKANGGFELLASPARLEIGPDTSTNWPSWELVWKDALETPQYVGGTPAFEIVDNGPAVVSLKITRTFGHSVFEQIVSLWDGGERVDVANHVQWFQHASNLRAAFPLSVSNPKAAFDLGLGAIESGNTDNYPYYQHVVHQWADLTAEDGSYGVSILNDCKYGMDKPNDNTLRLTLIHTPPVSFNPDAGQEWQDMGMNIFTYSIAGHAGFRDSTAVEAAQLNQPMFPFAAKKHAGQDRALSLLSVSDEHVVVRCVKKEEKGNRIIVRIQETSGHGAENVRLAFAGRLTSVTETNGYEDEIAPVAFDGNSFTCTLGKYGVKTFAVTLAPAAVRAGLDAAAFVDLPYDRRVVTTREDLTAGDFADGISIPAELYEENVTAGGVPFRLAPAADENAVVSAGQTIRLPEGYDTLYILAASAHGDKTVDFLADGRKVSVKIQDFHDNVGSWDMVVNGASCLIKRDEIAVNYTHTHDAEGDRLYLFAYLFKYALDIRGVSTITLPADSDILVMAATAVKEGEKALCPLAPLYDTVDVSGKPVHTATIQTEDGKITETRQVEEGRVFVLRAEAYTDEKVFTGWNSEALVEAKGTTALLRMGDHDVTVVMERTTLGEDVLYNKPCQASGAFAEGETGDHALNHDGESKWCAESEDGTHWLEVDAGAVETVSSWFTLHAGAYEAPAYNARSFRLLAKKNADDAWTVVDTVEDNQDNVQIRSFAPMEARYFRLEVEKSDQGGGKTVRLNLFQVFRA